MSSIKESIFKFLTNRIKKNLDKNIVIWVFNYKVNGAYSTDNKINTEYLSKIQNKLARYKVAKVFNIELEFLTINGDGEIFTKINEAKERNVDYFLYGEISTDKNINSYKNIFRSVNNSDFLKNNIENDKNYSRINIYDEIEFDIENNNIDISKLIDNIIPLIELNHATSENNFIRNLGLEQQDLNSEKYSWFLSLWKAIDGIKKYNKKLSKLNQQEAENLVNNIEYNLKVSKDEAAYNKKYSSIVNNEIIKFFSDFQDKKYRRLVTTAFTENIKILEGTDGYTDSLFNYFNYRFNYYIKINNPESLLTLSDDLDNLKVRGLDGRMSFFYLYYKSILNYAEFVSKKIGIEDLILNLTSIYKEMIYLIDKEVIVWNKLYLLRKIIYSIDYRYLNFDSIVLLNDVLQIDAFIMNGNYKSNDNYFYNFLKDDEYLVLIHAFLQKMDGKPYPVTELKNYYKFKLEKIQSKEESHLNDDDKMDIDLFSSRLNLANRNYNMDLYEKKGIINPIYFWLIRYSKTDSAYLDKISKFLNENKNVNLADLFNLMFILILNSEHKEFNLTIKKIIEKNEQIANRPESLFLLRGISLLYYDYSIHNNLTSNQKGKILYLIIVLSQLLPQIWSDNFKKVIYDELMKCDIEKEIKDEASGILNKAKKKGEFINLIDKNTYYRLFLDRNKFRAKKRFIFF